MNKNGIPLIWIVLSLALSSCRTTTEKEMRNWIFGEESLSKMQIPKGSILSKDRIPPENGVLTISNFGQVSWLNSILGRFDLHEELSLDEKKKLLNNLFQNIPVTSDHKIFRMTALGGFFESGENLVFYSTLYSPSQSAPEGSRFILDIKANCILTVNRESGETDMTVFNSAISPYLNWFSNGVIFQEGMVVKTMDLSNIETYEDLKNNSDYISHINLADRYTRDELKENDLSIPCLLISALEDPQLNRKEKVTAALNMFQYYLYKEGLDQALTYLALALNLGEELENEDFRRVLDYEAPHMYALMKYLIQKGNENGTEIAENQVLQNSKKS